MSVKETTIYSLECDRCHKSFNRGIQDQYFHKLKDEASSSGWHVDSLGNVICPTCLKKMQKSKLE